ncbi:MAG: hypothetical protein JSW34_11300 [Candidatus Zixiibacteriota bacterium]|nr:MAG: hypothetical protein JSW34_11300 [candidate division Zixibacteria bacterium]
MADSEVKDDRSADLPADEGITLEWTTHPMKRKPLAAVLVTLFILVVGFLVFVTTESKTFGTLALVVLFLSLAKFYMPTRYRLTDRRITVKTTTQTIHKTWSQFRSFYPDNNGVLLSPFISPSRLESFRGIYLIFSGNKDEVIDFVRARIVSDVNDTVPADKEEK